MNFSKLLSGLILALLFPSAVMAAVGVTSSELQEASSLIIPSGSSLIQLDGYESFSETSSSNITGGISTIYEARFLRDPFLNQELPQLKILVFSYATQSNAESAFADASAKAQAKSVLETQTKSLLYRSNAGSNVDVFASVTSEEKSLHLLHVNGNLLYQASLYRTAGEYNQDNIDAFAAAIADVQGTEDFLSDALEQMKLSLGILFPPTSSDFSAKSEKSSLNLSELYDIPTHGEIQFELYIGESLSAVGTVLDSSGIATPQEGDIYLYVQSDGKLLAGIYAPNYDADCDEQGGWYRIFSGIELYSYEWNSITLHYGVGGFYLMHEGVQVASCSLSQPRSDRDVYFGDFPDDSIEESVIGYLNDLTFVQSKTDSGLIWDTVLENQLFLDLSNSDPDLAVFQFLQEEGIFVGSDGMLYPDNTLNRAEMVKILLKAYEYDVYDDTIPFWDVPGDAWYHKYLATGYDIGMIEGHEDGRFLPGHEINRAEFYTMLQRLSGEKKLSYDDEFLDVGTSDWYLNGAAFALKHDLISSSFFLPSTEITRREAAQVLYELLK